MRNSTKRGLPKLEAFCVVVHGSSWPPHMCNLPSRGVGFSVSEHLGKLLKTSHLPITVAYGRLRSGNRFYSVFIVLLVPRSAHVDYELLKYGEVGFIISQTLPVVSQ